jgi:hypothetical protein
MRHYFPQFQNRKATLAKQNKTIKYQLQVTRTLRSTVCWYDAVHTCFWSCSPTSYCCNWNLLQKQLTLTHPPPNHRHKQRPILSAAGNNSSSSNKSNKIFILTRWLNSYRMTMVMVMMIKVFTTAEKISTFQKWSAKWTDKVSVRCFKTFRTFSQYLKREGDCLHVGKIMTFVNEHY